MALNDACSDILCKFQIKLMALVTMSCSSPSCGNLKLEYLRPRRMTHFSSSKQVDGLAFKSSCLEIPNSRMVLHQPGIGCRTGSKRINVATPNTSVSRVIEVLDACEDEYDGVIIDSQSLPTSANAFAAIIQSSLSYWKLKGKKGVWLKILEEQADLVPIALKEGFSFHHADSGYVMLTHWLPGGPCLLPSAATHQIGVAGFVINENREVLVVKEKRCPSSCSGIWKLPTGFINKAEEIFSAATREVKEETGIDTTFLELLAFRHAHHVIFDKSDLMFICMLKPLSSEIIVDESEIAAAKWMPLDEFMEQPFNQEDSMSKAIMDICNKAYEHHYHGFETQPMMSKLDNRFSYLYSGMIQDFQQITSDS